MMNRNFELVITCPFCGKIHSVTVRKADLIHYREGALAQRAFPYLDAVEREAIISGMCPACQNSFFGEECDEDWDWDEGFEDDLELIDLEDGDLEDVLQAAMARAGL